MSHWTMSTAPFTSREVIDSGNSSWCLDWNPVVRFVDLQAGGAITD
jgi:hypothetical protein